MGRRKYNREDVAMQTATVELVQEGKKEKPKTELVKATPWGEVRRGTFSIKVKSDTETVKNEKTGKDEPKVLYENENEPFEFDVVSSLANIFIHQGAKLTDDQIKMIGDMVSDPDDKANDKLLGEANAEILSKWNDSLKSNAKGKAYAAIFNRVKPVEGEKRDSAIASTINKLVKLMGVSPEVAIANLKKIGVVPDDYTLSDYTETKMRKSKADEDDE